MLLRKYLDEEGQDVAGGQLGPHYDMWIKISDALGIDAEVMRSFADVLPVYRYTVDAVFNFAKQQSWLEGVAATYATEGRMWKRYTPKPEHQEEGLLSEGEAMARYYGLPQDALLFYHVHSDANDEHGDINEAILKKYCTTPELQEKALAAARFRWENQETRHDIVYRYFVAMKIKNCRSSLFCRPGSLRRRSARDPVGRSSSRRLTFPTRRSPAAASRSGSPRTPACSRGTASTSIWSSLLPEPPRSAR